MKGNKDLFYTANLILDTILFLIIYVMVILKHNFSLLMIIRSILKEEFLFFSLKKKENTFNKEYNNIIKYPRLIHIVSCH